MKVKVCIINAFVDKGIGGNPAGVVLDAERLTEEEKLFIASKVGFSETAFVSPSKSADFRLEFFTPTRQIAHCGHATIATFSYLQQLNQIGRTKTSKETLDGNRDIFIEGEMAFMEHMTPKYTEIVGLTANVLSSLEIAASDLLEDFRPIVVNTGISFLIVPLKDEDAVKKATPNMTSIESISEDLDLIGYYLFSTDTKVPGRDAGARMFAPRYGIKEESATGMAAGPLGCFLYDKVGTHKEQFLVEQGHLMSPPSPSVIHVKLSFDDRRIVKILAGGKAKVMSSMTIDI